MDEGYGQGDGGQEEVVERREDCGEKRRMRIGKGKGKEGRREGKGGGARDEGKVAENGE